MGHESFSVRKMKPRSRELAIYTNALPLAYTLSPCLNFHFETGAQELSRLELSAAQAVPEFSLPRTWVYRLLPPGPTDLSLGSVPSVWQITTAQQCWG